MNSSTVLTVDELKDQLGYPLYASCFGKTTLPTDNPQYAIVVSLARVLADKGVGVIHGGYQDGFGGGSMQGYAHGAFLSLGRPALFQQGCSIGVPMTLFDEKWGVASRTDYHTCFSIPEATLSLRREKLLNASDFYVFGPVVGDGTIDELAGANAHNDIFREGVLGTTHGSEKFLLHYGEIRRDLYAVLDKFSLGRPVGSNPNLIFVNSPEGYHNAVTDIQRKLLLRGLSLS